MPPVDAYSKSVTTTPRHSQTPSGRKPTKQCFLVLLWTSFGCHRCHRCCWQESRLPSPENASCMRKRAPDSILYKISALSRAITAFHSVHSGAQRQWSDYSRVRKFLLLLRYCCAVVLRRPVRLFFARGSQAILRRKRSLWGLEAWSLPFLGLSAFLKGCRGHVDSLALPRDLIPPPS